MTTSRAKSWTLQAQLQTAAAEECAESALALRCFVQISALEVERAVLQVDDELSASAASFD